MLTEDNKVFEIQVPCDCHTEKMILHKFDEKDDDYFYMSFWVDSFYDQSIVWTIKERIKMAWLALRKGNYIHQELVLTREKITELRNNLTELLEKGEKK